MRLHQEVHIAMVLNLLLLTRFAHPLQNLLEISEGTIKQDTVQKVLETETQVMELLAESNERGETIQKGQTAYRTKIGFFVT